MEKVNKEELKKMFLENDDGEFKPNFLYIEEDELYYYGFELLKTAEEVYQEWLENNDKQIDICPVKTVEERLEEAEQENKLLKAQVEANASNNEFLESCIMEMAQMVYA